MFHTRRDKGKRKAKMRAHIAAVGHVQESLPLRHGRCGSSRPWSALCLLLHFIPRSPRWPLIVMQSSLPRPISTRRQHQRMFRTWTSWEPPAHPSRAQVSSSESTARTTMVRSPARAILGRKYGQKCPYMRRNWSRKRRLWSPCAHAQNDWAGLVDRAYRTSDFAHSQLRAACPPASLTFDHFL